MEMVKTQGLQEQQGQDAGKISLFRAAVLFLLFGVTFFLLQDVTGVNPTPIKRTLSEFPKQLDGWKATSSRESSEGVIKLLGVDDYIEYNYRNGKELVNFYAAYYESVGGGKGYHSPKNCIPGGGWGIDAVNKVSITPKGSQHSVTVSEMVIRNRNEYQVVYYWYQNRGRVIASEYWEKMYQVLDAITKKRRDGSFIRLMAYAPDGNLEKARASLTEFAALSLEALDAHLPGKEV